MPVEHEFDGVIDAIYTLAPADVVRADSEIALAANLQKWRRHFPLVTRLFSPRITDREQLERVPDLEYLFLFHRDGFIREQALGRIDGPLQSAFLFAAIAWRLNDWVEPVRQAAARCASRCFPSTDASIVAEAALALLARENSWGRWSDGRSALFKAFARPDVADALAVAIRTRPAGPMATVLRYALRDSGLDSSLPQLASDAVQPAVRAVAVQALIDGRATWPSGRTWQWVNKPMGIRRWETQYSHRPLACSAARIPLLEAASRDPFATVRRVAASALIRYELGTEQARRIAAPLLNDRSPSVRQRAEFIFKSN